MKHVLTLLAVVTVVAIGVAGVVHGEADDSPGLQLLGALLVFGAPALAVRSARRRGWNHGDGVPAPDVLPRTPTEPTGASPRTGSGPS